MGVLELDLEVSHYRSHRWSPILTARKTDPIALVYQGQEQSTNPTETKVWMVFLGLVSRAQNLPYEEPLLCFAVGFHSMVLVAISMESA